MTAAQLAAARHHNTAGRYATALLEIERHLRTEANTLNDRAEWDPTAYDERAELTAAADRAHQARHTNDTDTMRHTLANPWH